MAENRRHWFQFGVVGLLWLILTVAIATYGVREHRERLRAELELREARDAIATKDLFIARTERNIADLQKYSDAISLQSQVQRITEQKNREILNGVSTEMSTPPDSEPPTP